MTRDTDPAPVTASRTAETPHIQLLGQFHLAYGEQTCSLDSPRLQTLLAYLVLHCDAPQSRQQLAFLLFPDSTETQARTNLRKLIHHLRNALPDADTFLVSDGQTLHWNAKAPSTLDVAAFETAAAQASSATALREAVQLYRGELLPGGYDDWVVAERERLQQKYVETLERLILLLENQRDYRSAISYAEQLLRADPLREETYRHLMRLHHASGDEAGARRVYQTCVAVLQRELDAEPSVETRTEFERLNHKPVLSEKTPPSQEPAAVFDPFRAVRHNLPMSLTSFVGRAQQITDLKRLLSLQNIATRTRLVTLTGAGGSGKTRLAIQVAQDVLPSFQAGVWFVDLSPLTDPTLIPQTIAVALSVQEQPGRSLIDTLLDYLHDKELLLLLDNCEQFVAACAELVQTLLEKCPRLQILVTSRERLNLAGETVWLVPTLSLPETEIVNWMTAPHSEAVQLFVERASSALPTFALTQQNATTVAQICRRLDGIPLAIELAAVRIKVLTPAQIATRLEDAFRLLTRGSHAAPPRQQTLRAAMDWSYALLSEKEQMLFRRLSVFAGGFTLESAEQVCAGNDDVNEIANEEILDLLSDLVDKSLVMVSAWEEGKEVRYRMLEPIRQYARKKCPDTELSLFQNRHIDSFLNLALDAEPRMHGPDQSMWLSHLETEQDNLRAALEYSLINHQKGQDFEGENSLRLAGSLLSYWDLRNHWREGHIWCERALAHTVTTTKMKAARAKVLVGAGWLAFSEYDWENTDHFTATGLDLFRELGDAQGMAKALCTLSWKAFQQSEYNRAIELAKESEGLLEKAADKYTLLWLKNLMGEVAQRHGDYTQADLYFQQVVELSHELGGKDRIANSFELLGHNALFKGNYEQAKGYLEKSLKLHQEQNNKALIGFNLTALAELAICQNNYRQAIKFCEESLAIFPEIGSSVERGWLLNLQSLAACRYHLGLKAIQCAKQSLQYHTRLGYKQGVVENLAAFGAIALDRELPTAAVRLLSAATSLIQSIGSNLGPAPRKEYEHDIEQARGMLEKATFAQAWAEGNAMTMEQAVEYALTTT